MNDDFTVALQALRELVGSDRWTLLPSPPDMMIFIYPWTNGSVDSLLVKTETDCVVERTNPASQPVWRLTGTVSEVIEALLKLPAPGSPHAPHDVLDDTRNRDRDLGTP